MCMTEETGSETIYHPPNIQEDISSRLSCNFFVYATTVYITSQTAGDMRLTNTSWNKQFSQEEQKVCHLVQDSHPTEEGEKSQSGGEPQTPEKWRRQCHAQRHTPLNMMSRLRVETLISWLFHWLTDCTVNPHIYCFWAKISECISASIPCTLTVFRRIDDRPARKALPNNVPHQEEESILGRGAKVLSIYCYLLVRERVMKHWGTRWTANRFFSQSISPKFLNLP